MKQMKKDVGELKEKLTEYLSNREEVIFAFLYGSFAKGSELADSDLDIAVYIKENYPSSKTDQIWDDLQRISKKDVELLILNNANPSVAWEAIRGIPLVIKDKKKYMDFMLEVSSEALDFQHELEDIWLMKKEFSYAC